MSHNDTRSNEKLEMKYDEHTLPSWESLNAVMRRASDCTGQNFGADSRTEFGGRAAVEVEYDVPAHTSVGVAAAIADPNGRRCGMILPPKARIERIQGIDREHGAFRRYGHSRTRDGRTGTAFISNCFASGSVTSGVGFTSGIGVVDCRDSKNQHEGRQPLPERAAVPTAADDYQRPAGTNARGTPCDVRGVRGQ